MWPYANIAPARSWASGKHTIIAFSAFHKTLCGLARKGGLCIWQAVKNCYRNQPEYILPPPPFVEYRQIIRPHQPDKTVVSIMCSQPLQSFNILGWFMVCCAIFMRSSVLGRPSLDFSGLWGEISHHTSSSPSRFKASILTALCPACAGLNDPPNIPIFINKLSLRIIRASIY
jgi:hypothetical protein